MILIFVLLRKIDCLLISSNKNPMSEYNREEYLLAWLAKKNLSMPPFKPSEACLIWNRQDAWVRHPETQRWWYLPVDRAGREWIESIKTCSRTDLL
jgi:hypothetical protein